MAGRIIWEGPSLINGRPIVVIATGLGGQRRPNRKTGDVIQTWILSAGRNPVSAWKRGEDRAVCGDCPLRRGGCYVAKHFAPLSVWRKWRRGGYPRWDQRADAHLLAGRVLRLGSYGDPCAAPLSIWRPLIRAAAAHLGYSHQWRTAGAAWKRYLMASCDTPEDRAAAVDSGWRTFRVRLWHEPVLPGEFVCPASAEAGKRMTCARCRACDGATDSPGAASPVIVVHGGRAATPLYARFRAAAAPEPGGRVPLELV